MTVRPDADIVLFSPEGMQANSVDLPSTVFLTEFLYRFSFGSLGGLAKGSGGLPPPPAQAAARAW